MSTCPLRSESRAALTLGRAKTGFFRAIAPSIGWAERAVSASSTYRLASWARRLWDGSALARPLIGLLLGPWGKPLGVETLLGAALLLGCVMGTVWVLVAASIGVAFLLWDRARRRDIQWRTPPFGVSLSLLVLALFLIGATLTSVLPLVSFRNLVLWGFYILMFLAACDIGARGREENFIWPFLAGTAFSGFVTIYQKATGWVLPRASWIDAAFEEGMVRYTGTFTNPTFLGEALGLAIPITIALLIRKRDWRDRVVLLGFAALQSVGMLLSFSRGAWLGLIVSLGILAVTYDKRMIILGVVLLVLVAAVAPASIRARLMSSFSLQHSSNAYRMFIWRGSLKMLRGYLPRGIGLGGDTFAYLYPEFQIVQTPAPHAHSTYIQMLLELGLFGFLALCWFFLAWLRQVVGALFLAGGGAARWMKVASLGGAFAAIAGHLLQGIFEHTWYNPQVTMAFFAILGIASGVSVRIGRDGA